VLPIGAVAPATVPANGFVNVAIATISAAAAVATCEGKERGNGLQREEMMD
jgi:hypothetical protein